MAKLIFGCGYLGFRVAQQWVASGETVFAITRSGQRASELRSWGLTPMVADVTALDTLADLPAAETVLYAVGYDRNSGKSITEVYVEGLRNVLAVLPANTGRIIYVSSTGVYGQTDGEWVDERSTCEPNREGGRACLQAERVLQSHSLGSCSVILRMGGIYGPGRIPRRGDLEAGRPIPASERGFLNLIHVDDAAAIVLAAEARAAVPSLYTVTDGCPVQRGEYFRELARLIGVSPPTFEPPPQDSPRARRAASDKRVSNQKVRREFQVQFQFPSYREGLAAIVARD